MSLCFVSSLALLPTAIYALPRPLGEERQGFGDGHGYQETLQQAGSLGAVEEVFWLRGWTPERCHSWV